MSSDPVGRPGSRREARERAVELGYEAASRDWTVDELLASLTLAPEPYALTLLRLVEQHRETADDLIRSKATGWSIERMPRIDLLVMRMAVAELIAAETPKGVVLAEAVDLVSRYSTDQSGRFVNGVLSAIAEDLDAS